MKHLLAGLLLMAQIAAGQTLDSTRLDSLPGKSNYSISTFFEGGYYLGTPKTVNLNSFFVNNQVEEIRSAGGSFGVGLGLRVNRFKYVMLFNGPILTRIKPYSKSTGWVARQQAGSSFGLIAGYDILDSYSRRFFIYGGAGLSSVNYNLYYNSGQTIPFQSILQQPSKGGIGALWLRQAPYIELALEFSFREKRAESMEYTTRIGYRRGIGKKTWQSEQYQLSDPISDRITTVYIQYQFTWSTNTSKRERP